MTVPTENIEISYEGSGNESTTDFPFTFPVLDEDHLVVKVIDLSTSPNTEVRLIKNTHYEVHGTGNTGGGHVRLIDLTAITGNTRLTSQFNLLIQRKVPVLQEMDLQNQGGFIAENHERKFDYLTMIDQQLQAELDRCVKTTEPYGQAADRLLPSIAAVIAGMYGDIIDIYADYTVAQTNNGNLLRVDTSNGDVTITLPDTADLGADMRFSAIKWTDDDHAVIIQSDDTESINNRPSIRIDNEYYSTIVVSDKASGSWVALSSDTPPMKDIILDTFTADSDDQASYTLSYAPGNKNNTRLFINGEYVKKDNYSVSGTTLTLNATLAATIEEDDEVEVFYNRPLPLGVPALDSIGPEHLKADSVTGTELDDGSVALSHLATDTGNKGKIIGYDDTTGNPTAIDRIAAQTVDLFVNDTRNNIPSNTWADLGSWRVYVLPAGTVTLEVAMHLKIINVPTVGALGYGRIKLNKGSETVYSGQCSITDTESYSWKECPPANISVSSGWYTVVAQMRHNDSGQTRGFGVDKCSLAFVN